LAPGQFVATTSATQVENTPTIESSQSTHSVQIIAANTKDEFDYRSKLAEKLFEFRDARVHVSDSGRNVWVTQTGENPDEPAEIWILEIADNFSRLKTRHHFKLLNPVVPTGEYLTSDGKFFVTLDEAGRCGNSPRDLVIYDLEKGTSLARGIDEFLPAPIVKRLKAPVYMGGQGLRQWQRLSAGQNKYDAATRTFYPTQSRLAKSTSKIPFLSIHLPSGKVQVETLPENDSSQTESHRRGLLSEYVQTDWAMADYTRKVPAGSNDPVAYIGIFQPRVDDKNNKQLRLAFRRDPESGDYLPMDWDEFIDRTKSRWKSAEH
jgi:hypothetical protein